MEPGEQVQPTSERATVHRLETELQSVRGRLSTLEATMASLEETVTSLEREIRQLYEGLDESDH